MHEEKRIKESKENLKSESEEENENLDMFSMNARKKDTVDP